MADDPRQVLDRLIAERGEDYASLSRLIGRNAAYIQQFIKRGVPRRLDEGDRATLARYLRVDEALLGAPQRSTARVAAVGGHWRGADLVAIPRLSVSAAAGAGAFDGEEGGEPAMLVEPAWLRSVAPGGRDVSIISVRGDSMTPTLDDGDDILVDRGDAGDRLRDGIYVLRRDDMLIVKRVTLTKRSGRFDVTSDNLAHNRWTDVGLDEIEVVGRVVWRGRRLP
ncbi:phage repressor protein C with HTH and peptisase S24 domain [Sphingomonas jejuensis]|uniref:Phage repressor protein C with HTH and peptisase S24 domain n=1 Tax=Sphingomonas jejuensis TaxID=904715 RepID=A0ABX0XM60_9SPHN|nr:S24/S26 family peptidase [Sphingomonas jejuensis]NJC34324.1 phage repressor protein C with HTH and peptisase S24 domain [Sphingomonas jejuensis]